MESAELIGYYSRRAREYEAIYEKPERQADLAALRERVRALVHGRRPVPQNARQNSLERLGRIGLDGQPRVAGVLPALADSDVEHAMPASERGNLVKHLG